jgi:hypothetical protein
VEIDPVSVVEKVNQYVVDSRTPIDPFDRVYISQRRTDNSFSNNDGYGTKQ